MPSSGRQWHGARVRAGFQTTQLIAVDAGHVGGRLSARRRGVDGEYVTSGSGTTNQIRSEVVVLVVQKSVPVAAGQTLISGAPPGQPKRANYFFMKMIVCFYSAKQYSIDILCMCG